MEQGYPGTAPPSLSRKPFDLTRLPPEMQQAIMAQGQITFEDGSVVYADGTATGAGDSPDDYGFADMGDGEMPQSFDTQGYGGALDDPGPMNPLAGPMFKRFRQTTNAPMPGTPGGIGGGPMMDEGMMPGMGSNPLAEPLPDPFAPAETARAVQVPGGAGIQGDQVMSAPPTSPNYSQSDDPLKTGGSYGGRFGKRAPQAKPSGRPMSSQFRR